MASTKIPGGVQPPEDYQWLYGLSNAAEEQIRAIIHDDIESHLLKKNLEMWMYFSSDKNGEPQFWITAESPEGGINIQLNDETNSDFDWFVAMVMKSIEDTGGHNNYEHFLTQTAKAFGFLSLAATKQLEQLKSESNGQY